MLFSFIALFFSLAVSANIKIINAHPGVGPIAVIGDSLAHGYGASDAANTPASCFGANFAGSPVSDLSVPGRTSAVLQKNLSSVKEVLPKLVFVSSGGNDAIMDHYSGNYPAAKSMKEMGEIFDSLLATGAVVVYLGLNPPYPQAARLPEISLLAGTKGVLVVDAMNGFWNTPLMSDEFHPNDEGYKLMCTRIVEAVRPFYP